MNLTHANEWCNLAGERCKPSNEELIEFCQNVRTHEAQLLRHAQRLSGNPADGEDLVQEALIVAWKKRHSFKGGCRFSTWLYSILINRYKKYLRKKIQRQHLFTQWIESIPPDSESEKCPQTQIQEDEAFRQIRYLVEQLPHKHRTVILLRYFDHATLEEISVALGCSIGTVKSRMFHGMEKLRKLGAVRKTLDQGGPG